MRRWAVAGCEASQPVGAERAVSGSGDWPLGELVGLAAEVSGAVAVTSVP